MRALSDIPQAPMTPESAHRHQIASLLFTSLIRSSEKCKTLARSIIPSVVAAPVVLFNDPQGQSQGPPPKSDEEEEPPQGLLSTLSDGLTMSLRSRSISREKGEPDLREWDRVLVAYLILLSSWVWDCPVAVKDLLEEGGVMTVVCPPDGSSASYR